MSGEIGYDAGEYGATKQLPFRLDVEKFTLFSLMGDVNGKKVLDAGCGEGIYSRELINRGAEHVIAVDGDLEFVLKARERNRGFEGKIEFYRALIQDFSGAGDRDLVVGSYIMSYPINLEEAVKYCRAMFSHLRAGGRFIGFNNNPLNVFNGKRFGKYGCEKEMSGDIEGGRVLWRVEGMTEPIVNFYLRPETYEKAFIEAGFSEFKWSRVLLDPASQQADDYWEEFFEGEPPFVAMVAVK